MKEKKSFVVYCDWENTFRKIGKYEAGDLIQGIFEYMRTGEIPQFESFAVEAVFSLLVETFKRDRDKYYKMCERNAINGAKKWQNSDENNNAKNATGKNGKKQNAKYADNDNVNDNENENVNENENENVNENDKYNISISSSSEMRGEVSSDCYSEEFLEFWKAYPKKIGKGAAYKVFNKLKLTQKDKGDILTALNWQKKSEQWVKDNGQFIPYPATYLNQRRWEDEPQDAFIGDITDPDRYKEDEEDNFDFRSVYGE